MMRTSKFWISSLAISRGLAAFLLTGFATATAIAAICEPGDISYRIAHRRALEDFMTDPASGATRFGAGRIVLSSLLDEGVGRTASGYLSRLRFRESYSRIEGEFGPRVRETVYELESDANCRDFIVRKLQTGAPLLTGAVDPARTRAVRSSLAAYLNSKFDPFPRNTHSGDYSLRVQEPELCADGTSASLNVIRTHHASTGIVARVSSYRIDLASGQVLKEDVRWGRLLRSKCP